MGSSSWRSPRWVSHEPTVNISMEELPVNKKSLPSNHTKSITIPRRGDRRRSNRRTPHQARKWRHPIIPVLACDGESHDDKPCEPQILRDAPPSSAGQNGNKRRTSMETIGGARRMQPCDSPWPRHPPIKARYTEGNKPPHHPPNP